MADHPVFGAVLFAIGALIIALAYYGFFDDADASAAIVSIVIGHIFVFNGVLFFFLGWRKLERTSKIAATGIAL